MYETRGPTFTPITHLTTHTTDLIHYQRAGKQMLFMVAGLAFLTLIVNGTTSGPLLRWWNMLGMPEVRPRPGRSQGFVILKFVLIHDPNRGRIKFYSYYSRFLLFTIHFILIIHDPLVKKFPAP